VEKWTKDEKMAYYFWIDNLVLSHWSEYLDLKLDEEEDNDVLSGNKLELIDYYQAILDEVGEEFTWRELDEWYRVKYGEKAAFIRFSKDLFSF